MARFRAADLHVETKPDLTPVSEADRLVESTLRARIEQRTARRGRARRGGGRRRVWLDHRPDRRHAELHARDPHLGDADRLRGSRRRRLGARARPPLVGGARPGRVRERRADPRLARSSASRTRRFSTCSTGRYRRARGARGTSAASATSGRTCSSPRAPPSWPSTRLGLAVWDSAPLGDHPRGGGRTLRDPVSWNGLARRQRAAADGGFVDRVAAETVELGREQVARARRPPGGGTTGSPSTATRSSSSARPVRELICLLQPRAQPAGEQQRVRLGPGDRELLHRLDLRPRGREAPTPAEPTAPGDVRDGDPVEELRELRVCTLAGRATRTSRRRAGRRRRRAAPAPARPRAAGRASGRTSAGR